MSRLLAAAFLLGACAPPAREVPPVVDLRVCVETAAQAEAYRRHFKDAVAVPPRGGRDCDVTVKSATLNAGKVTVRSAYDGSVLAEIDGPVDLAPQLVKVAIEQGTESYRKVWAQRSASGFAR